MEYKKIYEQGKKVEGMIKDNYTRQEEAAIWAEMDIFREYLQNWEKAKDTKAIRGLVKEMNEETRKKDSEYRFVTINPADGEEIEFIEKVHKFMRRPCMKGEYVFEQRDEEFKIPTKGLHVHALVKFYPNLVRDVQNQMKRFCDKNHIKVMGCTEDDVQRRRIYMSGIKEGEGKMRKVNADKKMREFYRLDALYTC